MKKKKPEKLDIIRRRFTDKISKERIINGFFPSSSSEERLAEKINEIIDYLK